jgi:orotate phosphoribosyltransferase
MPTTLQDDRLKLKELLVRKSLSFGDVTLSSGEKSKVYVDGKLTTCFPISMPLIGDLFIEEMERQGWHPAAVGGLTVGADPIAFAIARESLNKPQLITSFIIRKIPKEHGKQKFIEGIENPSGCRVVIIDDVCTKGGSTGEAIEKARNGGMTVLGAICLVDRQQGATDYLQSEHGCKLASIFKLRELLAYYEEMQPQQMAV